MFALLCPDSDGVKLKELGWLKPNLTSFGSVRSLFWMRGSEWCRNEMKAFQAAHSKLNHCLKSCGGGGQHIKLQLLQPPLSYFHSVDFGPWCTSAISSLACCSLSGLLAHSSLASVSLFFCSIAWASCQRCHAFIRWSNEPCRSQTNRRSFHVCM